MTDGERIFFDQMAQGVFSIDDEGVVWRHKEHRNAPGGLVWKEITPRSYTKPNPKGYITISLGAGHKSYLVQAHRLVYIHFSGEIPDGLDINHMDGRKDNNRPTNLEAVTPAENNRHATQVLGHHIGVKNTAAKLSDDDVREIRRRYRFREGKRLADEFGVHLSLIHLIVHDRIWKHVS